MAKKKKQCLFLESASGYRITNQDRETVSIEDAKRIYDSGELEDWNLAFDRLARHFHFDLEATKAYYAAQNAAALSRTPQGSAATPGTATGVKDQD